MTTDNTSFFQVSSWDEQPLDEFSSGERISRARVTQDYSGVISGRGTVEYTLYYLGDGSAAFAGVERIEGKVAGRAGTFVIQHRGRFADGVAKSEWSVVPGSGSDDLQGISGEGSYAAGHDSRGTVSFAPVFG